MTSVKGFYGNDKKENRFLGPPGSKEKYFVLVKEDGPNKGQIRVYNEEFGLDRWMGVYDPNTGKITDRAGGNLDTCKLPGENFCVTKKELEYFTSDKGKKLLKQQGAKTVAKDLIAKGKGVNEARKEAGELVDENEMIGYGENNLSSELNKKGTEDSPETRRKFGTFVYPETLRQHDQDVIKFTILEYKAKGFKARTNSLDFFRERSIMKDRTAVGTIVLPIPANIGDANSVDWGEDSMNAVQAAMANIGINFLTQANITGTITDTSEGVKNNKEAVKSLLGSAIVEAATGASAGAMLARTKGVIMNPNMELLFKKPQLRPFNFTFKLAPRSRTEAITVINIIRTFKQSMAPIRSQSNLFLKTPHTYRLQYMSRGKVHPYLNMFKECALTNMSMKYTPDGNYATYEDGVMSSYEMTMQFKELEPVFNDDYEQSSASTIGKDTDMGWDTAKEDGVRRMATKIGY